MSANTKSARVALTNTLLATIASCGRRFFQHHGKVSYFTLGAHGKIWWQDAYTGIHVYPYGNGRWRGFAEGGTLRALVVHLRNFIRTGDYIPTHIFGPWPSWVCQGDLWGYGNDMILVRTKAQELGIIKGQEEMMP